MYLDKEKLDERKFNLDLATYQILSEEATTLVNSFYAVGIGFLLAITGLEFENTLQEFTAIIIVGVIVGLYVFHIRKKTRRKLEQFKKDIYKKYIETHENSLSKDKID